MAEAAIHQDSAILLELMLRQIDDERTASSNANQLLAVAREVFFRKGERIFTADAPPSHVFFIVDGAVRMDHDHEAPWLIEAPGLVGLLDAELERPHARTAVAVSDTQAFAVRLDDYFDIVQTNFALVTLRMSQVAQALKLQSDKDGYSVLMREPTSVARCRPNSDAGPCVPDVMGRAMNPFERLLMLRLCPLLKRAGMQALSRLAELSQERTLRRGEVLHQAGDAVTHVELLVHGQMEWLDEQAHVVARFGPPEPLGAYLGVGLPSHPFTCAARTPVRLLSLRYDDLLDVMEDHYDAAHTVMAFMLSWLEKLRERNGGFGPGLERPRRALRSHAPSAG